MERGRNLRGRYVLSKRHKRSPLRITMLQVFACNALLMCFTVGCAHKKSKPDQPVPLVSVIKLAPQTVRVYRDYVGRTDAWMTTDLRTLVTAPVTGFFFTDGQHVVKGELLYQLDERPFRIALDTAQAQYEKASADKAMAEAEQKKAQDYVARYAPLARINAVPRQEYTDALAQEAISEAHLRQAQANLQVANSNVQRAKLDLTYTQIRAPIAGTIGLRRLSPGQLASTNDASPFATISASDPLKVSFSVTDAEYLSYLAPRLPPAAGSRTPSTRKQKPDRIQWKLVLADGSTYTYPGRFYALSRSANVQTDTVQVELLYPNPYGTLRPGQYAQINADIESRMNLLLVPVSSVRVSQGTKIVSTVGPNNVVSEKAIDTDTRSGNDYIVKKGLSVGEMVIVNGEQKVKPGDKVNPQVVDGVNGKTPS